MVRLSSIPRRTALAASERPSLTHRCGENASRRESSYARPLLPVPTHQEAGCPALVLLASPMPFTCAKNPKQRIATQSTPKCKAAA